jgi:hypothetical protein
MFTARTATLGLLCLGKPDFEAIEAFREDEFLRRALGQRGRHCGVAASRCETACRFSVGSPLF